MYLCNLFIQQNGGAAQPALQRHWRQPSVRRRAGAPGGGRLAGGYKLEARRKRPVGVTAETVKPGDTIKARCHHLRDGSNGCLLGFLKAKDGKVVDWDGNNAPPAADF